MLSCNIQQLDPAFLSLDLSSLELYGASLMYLMILPQLPKVENTTDFPFLGEEMYHLNSKGLDHSLML